MRGTKRKRVLNRVIIRLNKFPSKVKAKKKKKTSIRIEIRFRMERTFSREKFKLRFLRRSWKARSSNP